MLKIKLINDQASLNNFNYVDVKEYVAGQSLSIKIQISDSETKQRLIPKDMAQLVATFQLRDGTELQVPATMLFDPEDRSMWDINLTSANTMDIIGSNFKVELDFNGSATAPLDLSDSTDLRVGMAYNVVSKVTFDGEC